MYPEKLSFDGFSLRTTRINEAVRLIYLLDKDFALNKNRTNENKSHLSCVVGAAGFEPATSCSQSRRDTGLRYAPSPTFCSGMQM